MKHCGKRSREHVMTETLSWNKTIFTSNLLNWETLREKLLWQEKYFNFVSEFTPGKRLHFQVWLGGWVNSCSVRAKNYKSLIQFHNREQQSSFRWVWISVTSSHHDQRAVYCKRPDLTKLRMWLTGFSSELEVTWGEAAGSTALFNKDLKTWVGNNWTICNCTSRIHLLCIQAMWIVLRSSWLRQSESMCICVFQTNI